MQTIIKEISVASRNGHTNTAELGCNGHSANNGHADFITLELPPTPRFAPSCLPDAPAPSAPLHPSSFVIPEAPSAVLSPPSSANGPCSVVSPLDSQPALAFGKRRRNGVIARLPQAHRDLVCRMLQNGVSYPKIVEALAEHSITVTERNISNWATRGGYHEWRLQQELALSARLDQDNLIKHLRRDTPSDLSEVGLQTTAAQLSQILLSQAASGQLQANLQALTPHIMLLCRLNRELIALQDYRRKHPETRDKQLLDKEIELVETIHSNLPGHSIHDEPPLPFPLGSAPNPEQRSLNCYLFRKNSPRYKKLQAEYAAKAAAAKAPLAQPPVNKPAQPASIAAPPSQPQSPSVTVGNLQPAVNPQAPALKPAQPVSIAAPLAQPQSPSVTVGNLQPPTLNPDQTPVAPPSPEAAQSAPAST